MKSIIKFFTLTISVSAFISFTLIWWQRFNMPYNEVGRYFDGYIVWYEQAVFVYALLSIFSFIITITLIYIIWIKQSKSK